MDPVIQQRPPSQIHPVNESRKAAAGLTETGQVTEELRELSATDIKHSMYTTV